MPKRLTPSGQAAPPVEPVVTGATFPSKPAVKKTRSTGRKLSKGAKYVYNLRAIECRVTLTSGRKIELKPRGQRGDVDIVNADEQQDPAFLANDGLIFEVIEPEVARTIIANQQTNSQQQDHPIWGQLRNENDKPYDQRGVTVEPSFESQGIAVGKIEQTGGGRFTDKNVAITRTASPEIVEVPGSPGHPATELMHSVPSSISPEEYHEFLLWKQFKEAQAAKEAEGKE